MIGNAFGISGKYWLPHDAASRPPPFAWCGGLAWSLEGDKSALAHADYVVHEEGALRRLSFFRYGGSGGRYYLYYGAGLRVQFFENNRLGVRVPVGIDFESASRTVDAFLEVVPIMDLASSTKFRLNAAVGFRIFPPQNQRWPRPGPSQQPPTEDQPPPPPAEPPPPESEEQPQ